MRVSEISSKSILRLFAIALMSCNAAIGAETASGALEINACTLLTDAEISRVVGFPVAKGIRQDEGPQKNRSYSSACVWVVGGEEDIAENPNAPLGGRSFVILNAMQWPRGSGLARTFLEAFHSAAAHGEIASKPAPRDFGDEALWWGDGLAVRVDDVSFGLSVFIPARKSPQPGQFEEQLAPFVLKRLAN
jgi:hypothetical protein